MELRLGCPAAGDRLAHLDRAGRPAPQEPLAHLAAPKSPSWALSLAAGAGPGRRSTEATHSRREAPQELECRELPTQQAAVRTPASKPPPLRRTQSATSGRRSPDSF